ncbi:hypothetical protein LEP1GSC187_1590 [Leptospira santarosai str. ZUN179]|uniref:Uncharacterized protein n=1 Tax=Leptospira santarosai str. ZUN179 TaxID=1049985 RepID=M6V666_9LEPT|nr:hypothetical protein LEP1GSC187_1590 [Leptospira santarosai str. ZUN179]
MRLMTVHRTIYDPIFGFEIVFEQTRNEQRKNQNGKTTRMNEQNPRFTSERRTMQERSR